MRSFALFLWVVATVFSTTVRSDEEHPRLVIDPQGHSGIVWELRFTPDGKKLISLGNDKAIRVWEVQSGRLLKTLRGQIGDGPDGKLYAGAISPNGKYLAVGGFLSSPGIPDDPLVGEIRLINLVTGRMDALLTGHTDAVLGLAFSPDGKQLASGSSDDTVRLWSLDGVRTAGRDDEAQTIAESEVISDHRGDVYVVDYSADGSRFLTGARDGLLYLYQPDGSKMARIAELKQHSAGIGDAEISSDGKTIVSGGMDHMLLRWSGVNGEFQEAIDDDMGAPIGTLSFSPDGSKVMASSAGIGDGKTAVYSVESGKELFQFKEHDNTVLSSDWHPNEDLIASFGGDDNDIYLWNSDGVKRHIVGEGRTVWNVGVNADDPDLVAILQENYQQQENPSAPMKVSLFNFSELNLSQSSTDQDDGTFSQGLFEHEGVRLEGVDAATLKVGNIGTIAVDAANNDQIRIASFTADGSQVVVGSSFFLSSYEKSSGGMKKVHDFVGHTADVWTAVPSLDGQYLASGSLDQSVKFWNLETGELLASLFLAQNDEWVCWTPTGHFSSSGEGGKMVGWHLNRGRNRMAEYISGDQLFEHFFRPDVVKTSIVEGRSSREIVDELGLVFDLEAAMKGMVEVEFVEPSSDMESSQRRITVKVAAVDQGGGIGAVQLFHEGKALQPDGPGAFRGGRLEVPYTVSLMSGQNEITTVAMDPEGVESPPESIMVDFAGTKADAKLYILAVGLNEYKNPRFELNYCRPDVDAFTDAFQKRSGKLFTEIIAKKLYDAEATRESISSELEAIASQATPEDVFVFAFAGHGVMSEGEGGNEAEFHLIPYDVTQMYGADSTLAEKAISGSELQRMAANIPARKQLMVLDACQSGGVVDSFAVRGAAEERALAQLARSSGMYVLASTRSEQFATETAELGHGLFTYALLEALEGKGDFNQDGKITVKEVEAWLNERVPELSEEHIGAAQYPNSFARGQDFPIGLIE